MLVPRVFIIFMARATCVSIDSNACGIRPVRFFDTLSSGENEVPVMSC